MQATKIMQSIISKNPSFWRNINTFIEQCILYLLKSLTSPRLLDASILAPLNDDDFIFLNNSLREVNKIYAKKNKIPCKKHGSISIADERKWQEDTFLFLTLIKEACIPKLPKNLPFAISMYLKVAGDMMLYIANSRAISYTQKKEDIASYSYMNNINYYNLCRNSFGGYSFVDSVKADDLKDQEKKNIELYQNFIQSNTNLVSFCQSIAEVLSDIFGCEQQKLFAIFKIYCFRRYFNMCESQESTEEKIITTISLDFPSYVTDLLLISKRTKEVKSSKKLISPLSAIPRLILPYLIFPALMGIGLVILDKSGESILICFAIGFVFGVFVEAAILIVLYAMSQR